MKARVKATGRLIQVMNVMDEKGNGVWEEISDMTNHCPQYSYDELEFIDIPQDLQKRNITEPDYWDKLKHQAAISAMQGLLTNPKLCEIETSISLASTATTIASALIDKLKEESK